MEIADKQPSHCTEKISKGAKYSRGFKTHVAGTLIFLLSGQDSRNVLEQSDDQSREAWVFVFHLNQWLIRECGRVRAM